jgi:murein DD-endopeptidase MepM/ murein hydrolase activator NlpD
VAFEPEETSAVPAQPSSVNPDRPLTRREIRELEKAGTPVHEPLSSDDLLAQEMERQLRGVQSQPTIIDVPEVVSVTPVVEFADPVERIPEDVTPPQVSVEKAASVIHHPIRRSGRRAAQSHETASTAAVPTDSHSVKAKTEPKKVRVKLKHSRPQEPMVIAPKRRKGSIARTFSFVAILFVAGLALATSVPAIALLSPEEVNLLNEENLENAITADEGQTVEGTGEVIVAGRDGVSISQSKAASQQYSTKGIQKLAVNVPVSTNGVRWPFDTIDISSEYGDRFLWGRYNFHTGLDFEVPYGTPTYAIADGIVSYVEDPGPYCGASVFIEHNVNGEQFTSVYCHLMVGIPVKPGDVVSKGQVVGNIGMTGITTGPHLHLEIQRGGTPQDPKPFLIQRAGNP